MKKFLTVTLASLALAVAANFGLASAHPFGQPTQPATPTPAANTTAPTTTTTTTGEQKQGHENEQDGESEGDD